MSKPKEDRRSAGSAVASCWPAASSAAPTLALLHETIPHQGVHDALAGNDGSAEAATVSGHGLHSTDAGHAAGGHAAFAGRPRGRPRAPTASTRPRSCATSTTARPGAWPAAGCCASGSSSPTDKEIEVAPGVNYEAWTYNGRVPGPTLRCREGELLRIRFANGSEHPHTIHFHGIHPAFMDGMPGIGEGIGGGQIEPGESFTYEFDADPFGLHLYHCHVTPLASHISRGLYGAFVDRPEGRAGPRPTSW